MSNLHKQYVTTMPDGSRWAVPVSIIAAHRAKHYAHEFGGDIEKSLSEDTGPLFDDDDYEIEDWAQNNMSWKDVETSAVQIKGTECDYEEGWTNGDHEVLSPGSRAGLELRSSGKSVVVQPIDTH